jgi:hypothetical protein
MTVKTIPATTLALLLGASAALAPSLALAQHACESTQTISCPEGHRYDTATQTCTPPPTS